MQTLREYYDPARLFSVINELCFLDHRSLWVDLVPIKQLRHVEHEHVRERRSLSEIIPMAHETHGTVSSHGQVLNVDTMRGRERSLTRTPPKVTTNNSTLLLYNRDNSNMVLKSFDGSFVRDSLNYFSGCLQRHVQWDHEYLALIPRQYRSTNKMAVLELKCYRGMFCSRPALVQFSYPTSERSDDVDQQMQSNRMTVQRFTTGDETSFLFGNAITLDSCLRLEFTVEYIIRNQIHDQGVKWFFTLASAYDTMVSQYPTLKKFWKKQLLHPLAEQFMMKDSTESLQLLQAMLEPSGNVQRKIKLMAPYFNAMICAPSVWRSLLERVHAASSSHGTTAVLPLYKQFNIKQVSFSVIHVLTSS
jgi:hypothetical protein